MILTRRETDAILCACAAVLLAIFIPQPGIVHAQDTARQDTAKHTASDSAGSAKQDNSAQNKAQTQTAEKQSSSAADISITKEIRQSLIADNSLSMYAHNIKIITSNGVVTLEGPVRSAAEKRSVGKKAVAVAGEKNVKNDLSVQAQN